MTVLCWGYHEQGRVVSHTANHVEYANHTTTEEVQSRTDQPYKITIGATALLKLVDWLHKRRENASGGESCPVMSRESSALKLAMLAADCCQVPLGHCGRACRRKTAERWRPWWRVSSRERSQTAKEGQAMIAEAHPVHTIVSVKIREYHWGRLAIVYVRQSSPQQILNPRE